MMDVQCGAEYCRAEYKEHREQAEKERSGASPSTSQTSSQLTRSSVSPTVSQFICPSLSKSSSQVYLEWLPRPNVGVSDADSLHILRAVPLPETIHTGDLAILPASPSLPSLLNVFHKIFIPAQLLRHASPVEVPLDVPSSACPRSLQPAQWREHTAIGRATITAAARMAFEPYHLFSQPLAL